MFSFIFSMALSITARLLYVAIAVVLVRKYYRTRDIGFIWLGIAVVVWPLLLRWTYLVLSQSHLRPHQWASRDFIDEMILGVGFLDPFYALLGFIGVALLFVAVLFLSGSGHKRPADD